MADHNSEKISSKDQERSLKDLTVNTAALLCYLGVWISGIIFLILEQKNRFIRYHALQSIFIFGILFVAGSILDRVPVMGSWLSGILSLAGLILWIILMIKAGQGELFKLPWIGDLAERLAIDSMPGHKGPQDPQPAEAGQPAGPSDGTQTTAPARENPPPAGDFPQNAAAVPPEKLSAPLPAAAIPLNSGMQKTREKGPQSHPQPPEKEKLSTSERFKQKYYSPRAHGGRITGSAFTIGWSIVLIIFFNYFSKYIGYYNPVETNGTRVWEISPLITADWQSWLPIVTLALCVTIVAHSILLVYDRYIIRQISQITIDCFNIAAIIALISIFPFDFSPIPNSAVVQGLETGLPVVLVIAAVGTIIGAVVRFIMLIIHLARNEY
ncbi:MAG TPA: hypothetical protein VLH15_09195 [Dehalococcoidales bacterium]|nr:hypothetical protein [Dehalococcoidales bacterium]